MKKLKATDRIVIKKQGGKFEYIKREDGTYENKYEICLFGHNYTGTEVVNLEQIEFLLNVFNYELVEGEWKEEYKEQDSKEDTRTNTNTYRRSKQEIIQDQNIYNGNELHTDKYDELVDTKKTIEKLNNKDTNVEEIKEKQTVTGLEIIRDLRKNNDKSKYYNCKLKNLSYKYDLFNKLIKNGQIYTSANVELKLQSDLFDFLEEEFTLVKEEKEVTWQEAIEILTNQSDNYDVYFVDSGNNKIKVNRNSYINIGSIATSNWYVVEK